jgi:hypothetical protein
MHKSIFFVLTVTLAFGFYTEGVSTAAATEKGGGGPSRSVQEECARNWNHCWDVCKNNSCRSGCNSRYDICLKIEMPGEKAQ